MDLRQLRYFLAIAQEGNITAAADKLHMAQPPLSQQLKALEDELGVRLVERGSRRISLTDAGEILRNRAAQLLELAQSAKREIADYNAGLTGTLSLGAVSSSGLPDESLNGFHERYPGVSFEIHEGNTYQLLDLLKSGVIEVAVVRTPFNSVDLECRYAKSELMTAIFSGEDPFGGKERLSILDLKGKPLVIYRRFERLIFGECEEAGFEPLVACTNDDARTTINWVRSGYGIGLVPVSAITRLSVGLNHRVIDNERLRTQLTAILAKDRYCSMTARRFFECFHERDGETDSGAASPVPNPERA